MTHPVSRRSALAFGAVSGLPWGIARAAGASSRMPLAVPLAEPVQRLAAGGPTGLLGTGASGDLWALSASGAAARRIGQGLDAQSPLAGEGPRIIARGANGEFWAQGAGQPGAAAPMLLAPHAGLLNQPMAAICVVAQGAEHRLVRLALDARGHWREVARSSVAVLPDARPLQLDLDGRGDGGHIVVLAGPDSERYRHGVLGDGIEATRLLWLDRDGLKLLREHTLPAPHVFEDIAPRRVFVNGRPGLLTVRSGPSGAQLALLAADPAQAERIVMLAVGEDVGGPHRWLAPTTDGQHLLAVHTPHIGGVLHAYWLDGQQLKRRRITDDVSNHRIGTRELDLSVWVDRWLLLPSQDGRRLRVLDAATDWAEVEAIALPAPVLMTLRLGTSRDVAILMQGGNVAVVSVGGV